MVYKSSFQKSLSFYFLFILTLVYLVLVAKGNLAFLDKPYAWIPDTIHDMRNLHCLYDINSFTVFIRRVFLDVLDHYHGFLTFYIPAIIGYLPYKIYGDAGLLYTFRMCSAIFLLASYWLYSFYFFEKPWNRFLFFVFLLLLPFTILFCTRPRVESYLFFFTAIFLIMQKSARWKSNIAYFFLGLAVIALISIIPYIPFFLFLTFIAGHLRQVPLRENFKRISYSSLFLIAGILTGQPQLAIPENLMSYIRMKRFLMYFDTASDPGVTFQYWNHNIVPLYANNASIFYAIIAFFILLTTIYFIYAGRQFKKYGQEAFHNNPIILKILARLIPGLAAVISIFFIVLTIHIDIKWYLQHHYIFIIAGIFSFFELLAIKRNKEIIFFFSFFAAITLYSWHRIPEISSPYIGYYNLWERIDSENTPYAMKKLAMYYTIKNTIETIVSKNDGKLTFRITSHQYRINSTDKYNIQLDWSPSPFYDLDDRPDVFIIHAPNHKPPNDMVPEDHGEYKYKIKAHQNFYSLVSQEFGGRCKGNNCYKEKPLPGNYLLYYRNTINI